MATEIKPIDFTISISKKKKKKNIDKNIQIVLKISYINKICCYLLNRLTRSNDNIFNREYF